MPDPQAIDWPNRAPYEGLVVKRDDPQGLHRVKILIEPTWVPHGKWVLPLKGGFNGGPKKGSFVSPPLGAPVSVVFLNGAAENPRYIVGHHGIGEIPLVDDTQPQSEDNPPLAELTPDGDNKVWQDERIRIEVDARPDTYAIRISDLQNNTTNVVDIDLHSGQLGINAPLGILLKSTGHIRIDATLLTLQGRPVLNTEDPI
jgi:hypothetical protein